MEVYWRFPIYALPTATILGGLSKNVIKKSSLNTAWLLIKKWKRGANLVFSCGYMNKVGDAVKLLSLDTKNNSKVLGLIGLVVLH